MANPSLPTRLLRLPGFQRMYLPLLLESVQGQFSAVITSNEKAERDWNYMLTCASAFALSDDSVCLDAAFRISHFCLSSEETDEEQKAAAAVVMDRLTNTPSLKLAVDRGYIPADLSEHLPPMLRLEHIKNKIQYSVVEQETASIVPVNRFQAEVFEGARDYEWLSVSAPTSSGKSFILLKILSDFLRSSGTQNVVYIVPTRSLIQQVENDIAQTLTAQQITNVFITSVPRIPTDIELPSFVFVLTQERYEWLLSEEPSLVPQLLIVDEAQKIGDGSRGVLLQSVIDETLRRTIRVKVIFSSPMTENPEILLNQAPPETDKRPISSEHVAVNQNLIWVSQAPRITTKWNMELCLGDEVHLLGTFRLSARPSHVSQRLPLVVHALADEAGGNLVYVNGQADAEKAAHHLYELQSEESDSDDPAIADLINMVKTAVHSQYALIKVLKRQVAFHYGNMPLILKNEIERLFTLGKIKFLVCTSTLIEGVNLPAKSIFMRAPKKGRSTPLGEIDFWNLAGRAGRQGKEFQGNVICVDPSAWQEAPPIKKVKYPIRPTLHDIVSVKADALVEFIKRETPRSLAASQPDLEQSFVYLYSEYLRKGTVSQHLTMSVAEQWLPEKLDRLFQIVSDKIEIPERVVFQNSGISPLAQQSLLNHFRQRQGEPEDLIPSMPESDDALNNYMAVIGRISRHLSGDHEALNYYHALLILYWMRGKSLPYIISKNWAYWRTRGRQLPRVIRETMQHIEEYARFKFVKYFACYNDVLRIYLKEIERDDLLEEIHDMNIWLEFGASQATQIALMSLGLSRTSAITLSEYIINDQWDVARCRVWLEILDTDSLDISPIIKKEVAQVVERMKLVTGDAD